MSYITGDLQRQREALLLEAARAMPLGMTSKQAADVLGVKPAVARVALRFARANKTLVYIEIGAYRRWTTPDNAASMRPRLADEHGAPDGGQEAARFRREAAVMKALHDTPEGLTLKRIAQMLGSPELAASALMRRASKRGDAVSVRVATSFRWAAPQHVETSIEHIHAERAADKARRSAMDDPLLHRKPVLTRAGDAPPPITLAVRSIFEFAQEA